MYNRALCRSFPLMFDKKVQKEGIDLYRFVFFSHHYYHHIIFSHHYYRGYHCLPFQNPICEKLYNFSIIVKTELSTVLCLEETCSITRNGTTVASVWEAKKTLAREMASLTSGTANMVRNLRNLKNTIVCVLIEESVMKLWQQSCHQSTKFHLLCVRCLWVAYRLDALIQNNSWIMFCIEQNLKRLQELLYFYLGHTSTKGTLNCWKTFEDWIPRKKNTNFVWMSFL